MQEVLKLGSRIMHVWIAYATGRRLGVEDLPRFLLGGIAPDAHHLMQEPKDASHFLRWNDTLQQKYVDVERFAEKYAESAGDDYYRGYLTHLIADDVWLTTVFERHVLFAGKEERQEILPAYYADFRTLNGLLIERYGAQDALVELLLAGSGLEMDEVALEAVLRLKEEVRQDYAYEPEDLETPLQLFSMEEIAEYLETSIDRAVARLEVGSPVR